MKQKAVWFAVYLAFGAYMVNEGAKLQEIPAGISMFNDFIFIGAGGLLLLASVNLFRLKKKPSKKKSQDEDQ